MDEYAEFETVAPAAPALGFTGASAEANVPPETHPFDAQLGGVFSGKGTVFQSAADKYGIDPALLASIAMLETTNGTAHPVRAYNNPGGLMDPHSRQSKGFLKFGSLDDGIDAMARNLKRNYYDQGRNTIETIQPKYSPVGAANDPNHSNATWQSGVRDFMRRLQTDSWKDAPVAYQAPPQESALPSTNIGDKGADEYGAFEEVKPEVAPPAKDEYAAFEEVPAAPAGGFMGGRFAEPATPDQERIGEQGIAQALSYLDFQNLLQSAGDAAQRAAPEPQNPYAPGRESREGAFDSERFGGSETAWEAANTPYVRLPRPNIPFASSRATGALEGATQMTEGLETPFNAVLMTGMGVLPGMAQKLASGYFALQNVGGATRDLHQAQSAETPREASEYYTKAIIGGLLGGLAAGHAGGRPPTGGSIPRSVPAREPYLDTSPTTFQPEPRPTSPSEEVSIPGSTGQNENPPIPAPAPTAEVKGHWLGSSAPGETTYTSRVAPARVAAIFYERSRAAGKTQPEDAMFERHLTGEQASEGAVNQIGAMAEKRGVDMSDVLEKRDSMRTISKDAEAEPTASADDLAGKAGQAWEEGLPGADMLGELHKDPLVKAMLEFALKTGNRNPALGSYGPLREVGLVDEQGMLTDNGRDVLAKSQGHAGAAEMEKSLLAPETKPAPTQLLPVPPKEAPPSAPTAPENVTSIKNAQTDIDRAAMALWPAGEPVRRPWPKVEAEARAAAHGATDRLVAELAEAPREVSDTESAQLAIKWSEEKASLDAANDAVIAAREAGDEAAAARDVIDRTKREAVLQSLADTLQAVGTKAGQSLAARKMFNASDWSEDGIVKNTRAKLGGRQLTPEEYDAARALAKSVAEQQAAIDSRIAESSEAAASQAAGEAHVEMAKEVAAEDAAAKKAPPKPGARKAFLEKLHTLRDEARARLKSKRENPGAMSGPIDLTDIDDYAIILASHIADGVKKGAELVAEMKAEFGDAIGEHLPKIYARAKEMGVAVRKAAGTVSQEEMGRRMKDRLAGGLHTLADMTAYVREIAKSHIRAGIRDVEPLRAAVHETLKAAVPGIDRATSDDLFSQIGQFKRLSEDPVDKIYRDLKAQGLSLSKLKKLQAKQPVPKTGFEMPPKSDKQRALDRLVEEEKKKSGVVATDPATQLKSALGEIETRVKNQLRDAYTEMDIEKQAVRRGPSPERITGDESPEELAQKQRIEVLKSLHDTVRETVKAVRDHPELTDEARIAKVEKALEKENALMEQELSTEAFRAKKSPNDSPWSPNIAALQARHAALRAERVELRKLREAVTGERRIKAAHENLTRGLEANPKPASDLTNTVPPELQALREQTAMLGRRRQVARQMADLRDRIARGDYGKRAKKAPVAPDAELAAERGKLQRMKDEWNRGVEEKLAKAAWDNRTGPQRVVDVFKSALHFITAVKIIGHGTVGMITHAGGLLWRPSVATTYWRNFGRQFSMWTRPALHERLINEMVGHPRYDAWKKAGLAIDPGRVDTDYSMYAKWIGKLGKSGQRGFDALKLARLELAEREWDGLSNAVKTGPDAPEVMKAIADIQNKATGALRGRDDLAMTSGSRLASAVFFAPRLYASRWARVVVDPLKTAKTFADMAADSSKVSPAERTAAIARVKHAAEFAAAITGGLLVNQAILSATGSNQEVNFKDPTKSDWLKFKGGNKEVVADGGLLDPVRLLGQIVYGDFIRARDPQYAYREGTRFEAAAKHLGKYVRGKFNPTLGFVVDVGTGTDAQGRPLPWSHEKPKYKDQQKYELAEWLASQGPIPLSQGTRVAYDEMRRKGLNHLQAMDILKGAAVSVIGATGAHVSPDYEAERQKR